MKKLLTYLAVIATTAHLGVSVSASADVGKLATTDAKSQNETTLRELAATYVVRSERLHAVANQLAGGFIHIGTAYSVVDSEQHQCHALAVLLGKTEVAAKVAVKYEVNTKNKSVENAQDVGIAAHSMLVFTEVIDEVIGWDTAQREEEWSLGCVGKYGIGSNEYVGPSRDSFFKIRGGGSALLVLGNVEAGFYSKLKRALDGHPKIDTVLLGSDGGAVYEALEAGRYIRKMGLKTSLWNNCRSACVLVFLGGIERRIDAPYPALGFHQISAVAANGRPVAVTMAHRAYQDVAIYATEMGVRSSQLVQLMQKRPPAEMWDIKYDHSDFSQSLCMFKIATVVQRGCSAEDFEVKNPGKKDTVHQKK